MKKYIKYLLSLAVVCATVSCTKTVSLDESVDKRVNKVINGYIDELSSAENGWIANVMTNQGIYRFWMSFTNDNSVTMYTDNVNYPAYKEEAETSTYNIRSLLLPTLSFDTYSYIHIINDPADNISGGTGNQGLKTDFEFEIYDYKDGVFTMKGRLNRVPATLTRATAAEKAAVQQGGLMNVLEATTSYKKGQFLGVELGSTPVGIMFLARTVCLMWVDSNGQSHSIMPLTYTGLDQSVHLYEPTDIGGTVINSFQWDDAAKTYTVLTADGQSLPVTVSNDPAVSLFNMLGPNKAFTGLKITYDMYAFEGMTPEEKQELKDKNAFFKNFDSAQEKIAKEKFFVDPTIMSELKNIVLEFYKADKQTYLRMSLVIKVVGHNQIITMKYRYRATFDEANNQFTAGSQLGFEGTKNDQGFANYVYQTDAKPLCDMFKGSKFQIDWSLQSHGADLMGELKLLTEETSKKDATIVGALQ